MAADDTPGPRKQPRFKGSGAPATAADLNIVSDHAALVGNRKVGTTTERTTATTAGEVWEGLLWYDTTLGYELIYKSGGWVNQPLVNGGVSNGPPTDANGQITITHGLPRTPTSVQVTMRSDGPVIANRLKGEVDNITATTFRVTVYRNDQSDAAFASNGVAFHWLAFA